MNKIGNGCPVNHNQPRLASLGRTRETIEVYRGGANMYFHGEIYPLKLEMVINLTVVLRVGGSDE
jgi:hypothetical protein